MSISSDLHSLPTRRLPVYLLVDHSTLTTGVTLVSINGGLNSLRERLGQNALCRLVYVGLISFADSVAGTTLGPVDQFAPARLEIASGCTFGEAIERFRSALDRDLIHAQGARLGDHTPLVVVMLGGLPTDSWQAAGAWLQQEGAAKRVNVIGLAINKGAVNVLRGVCPTVLCLTGSPGADITSFFRWLCTAVEEMARVAVDGSTSARLPSLPHHIALC